MFINIGFGNFINSKQIVSIARVDSAPMKRLISNAKEKGNVIDSTQGRRTKSVIITTGGYVVLSALLPDTLANRYHGSDNDDAAALERSQQDEF